VDEVPASFTLDKDKLARIPIRRAKLEEVFSEKIQRGARQVANLVARCRKANLAPDFILLAGGTSRIPMIARILEKTAGLQCRSWSEGRDAIALGAAIHASKLWTENSDHKCHTINQIKNIMRADQGIVGWDWDGIGYENREFEISFDPPFSKPPIVQTSIQMLDAWSERDHTVRYWTQAKIILCDKATIYIGTWNNNKLGGCKISWLALGE
jgi:hypothetical protein